MTLIIGVKDYKMNDFLNKYGYLYNPFIVIDKMCNLYLIKQTCNVVIPFSYLNNLHLIEGTLVNLDELLLTVNVNKIIVYNQTNFENLKKICTNNQIPLTCL